MYSKWQTAQMRCHRYSTTNIQLIFRRSVSDQINICIRLNNECEPQNSVRKRKMGWVLYFLLPPKLLTMVQMYRSNCSTWGEDQRHIVCYRQCQNQLSYRLSPPSVILSNLSPSGGYDWVLLQAGREYKLVD